MLTAVILACAVPVLAIAYIGIGLARMAKADWSHEDVHEHLPEGWGG